MNPGHLVIEPKCVICGERSCRVELVPPGEDPLELDSWPDDLKAVYREHKQESKWRLLYEGPATGGGIGHTIGEAYANRIVRAFETPYRPSRIRAADFLDYAGICPECRTPYCAEHWNVSGTGGGRCPRGHFVSLDPHA